MHRDHAKFRTEIIAKQIATVPTNPVQFFGIETVERRQIKYDDALALTNYLEVRDAQEPSGWRKLFSPKPIVTGGYLVRRELLRGLV